MTSRNRPNSTIPCPGKPRDAALDGLRGVAVLAVYVFHYGGGLRSQNDLARAAGYLTQAGWVGVELFFVLSGFLITCILWPPATERPALGMYLRRRAWRILPVYYAALLAAALAALCVGAPVRQLEPVLVYAAFGQNLPRLLPIAMRYPAPLPLHHLWTVAVEAQFYLVWPPLLWATRTRRCALQLCGCVFLACCLFRVGVFWVHGQHPETIANWSSFLPTRIGALALGAALALLSPEQRRRLAWPAIPLLTAGSLLLFTATERACGNLLLASPTQFVLALPAIEVAAAGALACALQPGRLRSALSLAPLRWLGQISYGFYILHILLEPLFDRIGAMVTHTTAGTPYLLVRVLCAFPVSAAMAWLSYHWVEQPLLRLAAAGAKRRPGAISARRFPLRASRVEAVSRM